MRRLFLFVAALPLALVPLALVLVAGSVGSQTETPDTTPGAAAEAAQTGAAPTAVPEIPAGDDPMDRRPDPAAGTPAAERTTQTEDAAPNGTDCEVQHADTDTGFIVVCE